MYRYRRPSYGRTCRGTAAPFPSGGGCRSAQGSAPRASLLRFARSWCSRLESTQIGPECHISDLPGAYSLRNMRRTLVAVLAIGLLSACAGFKAPAASKSDTPQQSLAAAGKAMANLKSVRFDAKATVSLTLPASLVDQLRTKAGSPGSL